MACGSPLSKALSSSSSSGLVFRLPEPKDKPYEELDISFARRVNTREFDKYEVNAYAEDEQALQKWTEK
ncbi:general substrate transporter [Penicillium antarcticum]|uniref:general substrate transporter n=1 Tax=Penicillium antarcticum TaxID=416450 RepID=UPI0023961420|nr:general substrate transporter [Penicillium antarcticum]KAJ5312051.1 general substrate transporter [Penicillium antarcticum]